MNNEGFVFTMTFEVKTKVALGMDVEIFFGQSQKNWNKQPGGCFSRRTPKTFIEIKKAF
jgi:hypothetical protein